jgi:hypothetical protein
MAFRINHIHLKAPDPRIAFLWAPDDVRVELIEARKSGGSGGC